MAPAKKRLHRSEPSVTADAIVAHHRRVTKSDLRSKLREIGAYTDDPDDAIVAIAEIGLEEAEEAVIETAEHEAERELGPLGTLLKTVPTAQLALAIGFSAVIIVYKLGELMGRPRGAQVEVRKLTFPSQQSAREADRMDVYEALYTTRAMRRVRPDPIPVDVQAKILDAAVRAPTGGNVQNWRFLLVDDPAVLAQLGPIYRDCLTLLWGSIYKDRIEAATAAPDDADHAQFLRVQRSAQHLADNFESYPLLLFSFVQHDPTGGSIHPATWSAMLTARAEGVGSSMTSVFMFQLDDVLEILGVPKAEGWIFSSCVTFGYPTGRWGVAPRRPVHEVSFRNRWGTPLGFEVAEPLWEG